MTIPDPTLVDWVPVWAAGPVAGYVPSAFVYRTTNQTGIANTTNTPIAFDAKLWDTDGIWSAGAPTRLTCRTAGKYAIAGAAWLSGAVGGNYRILNIVKNGATFLVDQNVPTALFRANAFVIVDLAVGEYVELSAYQDTGSAMQVDAVAGPRAPWLSMAYLGPNVALGAVIPPTYGTSLPASPADGQEAILVDSVTNPTYQWRFRYNAGSVSAYKWEYIGGAPMVAEFRGTATAGNGSQKVGTGLIAPRAGLYDVDYGVVGQISTANSADVYCELRVAGSAVGGDWQDLMAIVRQMYDKFALTKSHRATATAGGAIDVYAGTTSAPTVTITAQHIRMTPWRVS